MSEVELTVLMPVYNGSAFLREAIESVLKQTYTHFEFLIINDGSSDDSEQIIKSFRDERIVYVKNERNEGLISSLNKGLKLAKGKFIARMDADDVCLPDRFKEQLHLFHSNPSLIALGCDYFEFNERGSTLIHNESDSDYQKAVLIFATCFAHPTVMLKNVFSALNVDYNKSYLHTEDYKLWTDLALHGEFGNVSKPLLRYRRHSGQITNLHRRVQFEKSSQIRKEYCEKLGFRLGKEQYEVLDKLGNNVFVTDEPLLIAIQNLLDYLIAENNNLKRFNSLSFLKCIHRFWYDICGHTSLGVKAYAIYSSSAIAKQFPVPFSKKAKLLAKCVIRKFRN